MTTGKKCSSLFSVFPLSMVSFPFVDGNDFGNPFLQCIPQANYPYRV